jgi:hypothetical protein
MSLNYTATTSKEQQRSGGSSNGHLTQDDILKVLKSYYRLKPNELQYVHFDGMEWDRDVLYVGPGNKYVRRSAISGLLKRLNLNAQ